jgi:hypothetical protein
MLKVLQRSNGAAIFRLNVHWGAIAMFDETLENLQHLTRLIPESRGYKLNSSHENLIDKQFHFFNAVYFKKYHVDK